MSFSPGDRCPHSDSQNYHLTVSIVCDQNRKNDDLIKIDTNSLLTPCSPKVLLYSDQGCPNLKINPLFEWLEASKYWIAPILGLLGIYLMLFSLYMYKPTCYIIGFCSTPVLILGTLYTLFMPTKSDEWIVFVLFIISIIIGLIVGYLTMKNTTAAKIMAGFFAGWVVHSFLFIYFTHRFTNPHTCNSLFWCMLIIEVTAGAILGALYFPISFIVNTSLVGSYIFYRCIAIYAGGFVNEFAVVKEREEGRYTHIDWRNYIYVLFIFITATLATIIQYRINELKYYDKSEGERGRFQRV